VTGTTFKEWFCSEFVSAVKEYLLKNNLALKCLLLDNAPGHPQCIDDLVPEIKVVFLPPNTTSLLQLMDQTVIATFKRYYVRRTITHVIAATGNEASPTLKEFWKGYNIWNRVNNIRDSWAEIKQSTMNRSWKKLYPQFVLHVERTAICINLNIKSIIHALRDFPCRHQFQMKEADKSYAV
jgi:hypothetical protein